MAEIPVLAFAGYSGSGKTTVIEALIPLLRRRGLRVAVVKHDAHSFEMDRPGKDSWRFSNAGAEMSIISSPQQTAVVERRPLPLLTVLSLARDVDIILVEGYKNEALTQIGVCRRDTPFPETLGRYRAVVTDAEVSGLESPQFRFDGMERLAEFIFQSRDTFTKFCRQDGGRIVGSGDLGSAPEEL